MSRILVTGGCGFIGGHVVGALLKSGHLVMTIDNMSSGKFSNLPKLGRRHLREWDILDLKLMDVIFHNFEPECVIHLAAQPSLQKSWKAADFDAQTNILGTINILGLCQRYKVKRFVFASTSAVYSRGVAGIYDESSRIFPTSPYGVSKYAAEQYIRISKIPYANILRLGNVYGPRQVPLGENQLIPRALAHIFQGEPFVINGDGKQRRDFVYVEDVAGAFCKAVESDTWLNLNIGTGKSYSVNEILDSLSALTGYSNDWGHGPKNAWELHNVQLVSESAEHYLRWKAETSLISGLRKTVEAWPKEYGFLI